MTTASHLDDDQLTALQDGDGADGERAHLEGCERCRARSQALVGAAALVAAPPPPPSASARDAAIAAALREADRPVPAAPRRPRRRAPSWLAPVAAVVALLALIAVVVPQLETGNNGDDSGGGDRAATAQSRERDDAGGAGGAAGNEQDDALRATTPPASDLGVVDDEADLARRVDEALAAEAATDAAGAPGAPRGDEERCEASFRSLAPPLGPLRLRASLVWRGDPAEVVSDGEQAVVLATGGCTPLARVALP